MSSVTLSSLITKVRNCGDFRSPQFTDERLEDLINLYIEEYWNFVLDHGGEDRLMKFSSDLTVTAGTETVTLPTDFLALYGVAAKDSSSTNTGYVTLMQFDPKERNLYGNTINKLDSEFALWDGKLYLRPVPNWSGYIRILYVPEPTFYDSDGSPAVTSFTFINGGQQLVMWLTAEHCAVHLGESASFYEKKIASARANLLKSLEASRVEPRCVVDNGIIQDYRTLYPQMRGYSS